MSATAPTNSPQRADEREARPPPEADAVGRQLEHRPNRVADPANAGVDLARAPAQHLPPDQVDCGAGMGDEVGRIEDPALVQHASRVLIGQHIVRRIGDDVTAKCLGDWSRDHTTHGAGCQDVAGDREHVFCIEDVEPMAARVPDPLLVAVRDRDVRHRKHRLVGDQPTDRTDALHDNPTPPRPVCSVAEMIAAHNPNAVEQPNTNSEVSPMKSMSAELVSTSGPVREISV